MNKKTRLMSRFFIYELYLCAFAYSAVLYSRFNLEKSLATISFTPQGNIISANSAFLDVMGYSPDEIEGQHRSIFCDKDYVRSHQYEDLWRQLRSKKEQKGTFLRRTKHGKDVWLQATYLPLFDNTG